MSAAVAAAIKMKELEARTGVGREAIRFYIREGMLPEPEKPKRNVAFYSDEHVKRLLAIRHLREEREMSLARIKSVLDSAEFEALAGSGSLAGLERLLPALLEGVTPVPDQPVARLLEAHDVDRQDFEDLCRVGAISPEPRNGEHWVEFRDAAIVRSWAEMRAAGYDRDHGYAPRILARYRDAAEELAAAEVDEFFAAFEGDLNVDDAARIAAAGIQVVNEIFVQLHVKALMRRLAERLRPEGTPPQARVQ
ncbi:MAG: MerR family transcriptional regulator [Pseudomonadales bacterium]